MGLSKKSPITYLRKFSLCLYEWSGWTLAKIPSVAPGEISANGPARFLVYTQRKLFYEETRSNPSQTRKRTSWITSYKQKNSKLNFRFSRIDKLTLDRGSTEGFALRAAMLDGQMGGDGYGGGESSRLPPPPTNSRISGASVHMKPRWPPVALDPSNLTRK